jgi:hypothetical protein
VHCRRTEQEVLADCDAFEPQLTGLDLRPDQAEIGRAAADVAHQDQRAIRERSGELAAMRRHPGVECGQRLFEQDQLIDSRLPRPSAHVPPRRTMREP